MEQRVLHGSKRSAPLEIRGPDPNWTKETNVFIFVPQCGTKPCLRLRRKHTCGFAAGVAPFPGGFSKEGKVGPGPWIQVATV